MMTAGNKKAEDKNTDTLGSTRSIRADAEKQLAHSQMRSPELKEQTPEQHIHELQVHQIELETQAEELRKAQIALEESRDNYLDLYDFAPLGYLTLNDKAQITEVNLNSVTLLGIERSKLLKTPFSKFVAEKDGDEWYRYFKKVLSQEGKQTCTLLFKRGDGSTFPARLESIRITGGHDETPIVRVAISDITDIRLAEDALRESGQRIIFSLDSVDIGAWDLDLVTHTAWRSLRHDQIFGYEELLPEWTYEMFIDHVIPEDRPIVETKFGQALANFLNWEFECRIRRKDGAIRWIWAKGRPEYNDLHEPKKMFGLVQDITERKQAEEALQKERNRLYAVLETLPAMICLLTPDYHVAFANRSFREMFGESHGRHCYDYCFKKKEPCEFCESYTVLKTGKPHHWEVTSPDNSSIIDVYDFPFTDDDGSSLILEMDIDITDRKLAEEALKTSQIQLAEAMNLAQLVNWEFDVATGIFTFDDRFYAFYGTTAELEGGNQMPADVYVKKFVHPDDQYVVADEVNKAIQATDFGYESQVEHRIIRRNGEIRHIVVRFGITKDKDGRTIKTHGANQDITERKRAEEALRKSEEKYRTIFENTGTAMVIVEEKNIISLANKEFAQLSGFSKDDIEGKKSWTEFVMKEDLERMLAQHRLRRQNPEKALPHYEFRFVTKSGDIRNIHLTIDVIPGTKKSVASLLDITERKQAEEALRESEERFRGVAERSSDLILLVDERGKATYVSPSAERILGYLPGEIEGKIPEDFIIPEDLSIVRENINKNVSGEHIDGVTIRFRKKSGEYAIVEITAIPVIKENRISGIQVIMRDVTERKMMESEIRSLNRDLEQRVIERTSQLNASLEDKIVLLREVHHRVKNNLQIIISLFNLQSRYIVDENTRQVFRESQNRVRAMSLVHEKLYQSTDIAKIDLDNYIRYLGNSLFQFYGVKGKEIVLNTHIQDINLNINTAIPVGLMINELISNSLKHAFPDGKKGEISLTIQRENAMLTILFADTGVGIPADLDWRNAESLGLRLVILLVDQLDGTIELDRSAGTAFTIVVAEKE